jgi:hypothetical protein
MFLRREWHDGDGDGGQSQYDRQHALHDILGIGRGRLPL